MTNLTFGERLADLRIRQGLSQKQLGQVVGVKANTISNYETDRLFPPYEKLAKIVAYFDLSYDELLGRPVPGGEGAFARDYTIDDVVALLLSMKQEKREAALAAILSIKNGAKIERALVIKE